MKNKRNSERDDYRLLKNKLLIRTLGILLFAFAFLATLYSLFLKGHIANTFVGFLDNFVYHDYNRALNVYLMYIRDYRSLFFVVLSLLLFAIILRFYLNEFSKYFKEINRSIDALIEENSGDIVLPWTDIVRHISKSVLNPLTDARFQQDCFVQFWQEPT